MMWRHNIYTWRHDITKISIFDPTLTCWLGILQAAIRAIQQAKMKQCKHLTIYTDSAFLINCKHAGIFIIIYLFIYL